MTIARPLHNVSASTALSAAVAFAEDIYRRTAKSIPYRPGVATSALQSHAIWAHIDRHLPLDANYLFRRDVIATAVSQLPFTSEATLGRRRAILLRVGEALGIVDRPFPPLSGSAPSTPFSPAEVTALRVWASTQRDDRVKDSWALLALGLGAGLTAREIMMTRAADVRANSVVITSMVQSRNAFTLPIWRDELSRLANDAQDSLAPLFKPHVAIYPNKIGDFVRSTWGDYPRPTPQRLRATWLVEMMAVGLPVQDLLYVTGLRSLDALARYERFLPSSMLVADRENPSGA